MISETARPEIRADSPQRKWVLWASRLARLLVTLGVLALLSALLAVAAPRLLGYQSYVIYGSSMEPTIRLGSLILTEPVDAEQLQVGDIIAFRTPNEITVTHRIVAARHRTASTTSRRRATPATAATLRRCAWRAASTDWPTSYRI